MQRLDILNTFLFPIDTYISSSRMINRLIGINDKLDKLTYDILIKILLLNFKFYFKLKGIGVENIPNEGGVILACNHQSWLDATCVGVLSPRKVHFLAKSELFKMPVLRHFLELAGALEIKRGGDKHGLMIALETLKSGKVIGIFPEGTIPGEENIPRSAVEKETGLLKGRTGVIRLALRAKVPIIPVGISGAGDALPPEAFPRLERLPIPKNVPITVSFGKPIYLEEYYDKEISYEILRLETDKLMKKISELII